MAMSYRLNQPYGSKTLDHTREPCSKTAQARLLHFCPENHDEAMAEIIPLGVLSYSLSNHGLRDGGFPVGSLYKHTQKGEVPRKRERERPTTSLRLSTKAMGQFLDTGFTQKLMPVVSRSFGK